MTTAATAATAAATAASAAAASPRLLFLMMPSSQGSVKTCTPERTPARLSIGKVVHHCHVWPITVGIFGIVGTQLSSNLSWLGDRANSRVAAQRQPHNSPVDKTGRLQINSTWGLSHLLPSISSHLGYRFVGMKNRTLTRWNCALALPYKDKHRSFLRPGGKTTYELTSVPQKLYFCLFYQVSSGISTALQLFLVKQVQLLASVQRNWRIIKQKSNTCFCLTFKVLC